MPSTERFNYLLDLYVSGGMSAEERNELFELISTHRYDDVLGQHMLRDMQEGEHNQSADLPPHIAQEIVRNIYQAEKNTIEVLPVAKQRSIGWRWIAAASVLLLTISAALLFVFKTSDKNSFASFIPDNILTQTNQTSLPKAITLADGSIITLAPQSTLHVAREFSGDKREVYLQGEAFFEVIKNPRQPFFVYYNDIVTKVLGTSFTINTNGRTGNIEVSVRTGKVQVYENERLSPDKKSETAVIITPNQKAIYKKENRIFETTLVDQPQTIVTAENAGNTSTVKQASGFVFEQAKLLAVFKQIEDSYGIEIVTENAAINDCLFTGDVSASDLYTKLKIICLTVNAAYEINGTKILIKGKGCN